MNSFNKHIDDIGYLSDEQLDELINGIEKNGMLKAPGYMKTEMLLAVQDNEAEATAAAEAETIEMLNVAAMPTAEAEMKQTANAAAMPVANKEMKNRQFRAYVFKVMLAGAAAIAFLFMSPVSLQMPETERTYCNNYFYDNSTKLMKQINDHSTKTMDRINELSDKLIKQ